MEWMIMPLKRYADFSGRSRRMEFWMWVLFVIIIDVILSLIDKALGLGGIGPAAQSQVGPMGFNASAGFHGGLLTIIFGLAVLIPNIAVSVRRLHDINRSGWWILMPAVPYVLGIVFIFAGIAAGSSIAWLGGLLMLVGFIGAIVLLVWYCLRGTAGPNRFGEDPLDPASIADLEETFG